MQVPGFKCFRLAGLATNLAQQYVMKWEADSMISHTAYDIFKDAICKEKNYENMI